MEVNMLLGELIPLMIMAFALSMDAFSVSLGMGMLPLRLKRIFNIGVTIGMFHIIMPLLGILVGNYLTIHLGQFMTYVAGFLLAFLGVQMIISSFKKDHLVSVAPIGLGLLMFSLSVSLDSFSVGLSLGVYGARTAITVFLFGVFSMALTWLGLLLGRKVQHVLGAYGVALGGFILLGFGVKLCFPI